jgi:lipopolysaccharide transport system permease protein
MTLPLSSAASGLIDFTVGLSFLVILMAYYQVQPGWPLLLVPVFLIELVLVTVGISLLLAALNVWYRDVKYVLPLLIQLWLFVTPVIYPISFIPEQFRPLMALNPLTGIVEGIRTCVLLGQWPDLSAIAISLPTTLIVFIAGLTYFRGAERSFADII